MLFSDNTNILATVGYCSILLSSPVNELFERKVTDSRRTLNLKNICHDFYFYKSGRFIEFLAINGGTLLRVHVSKFLSALLSDDLKIMRE